MLQERELQSLKPMILAGMSDTAIAGSLGVNISTFKRWLRIGNNPDPMINHKYRELANIYNRAKATLERDLSGNILMFAKRDWRAAAWFLERHFQEEYNPTVEQIVNKRLKAIVEQLSDKMNSDSFNELIECLAIIESSENSEIKEREETEIPGITVEAIAS